MDNYNTASSNPYGRSNYLRHPTRSDLELSRPDAPHSGPGQRGIDEARNGNLNARDHHHQFVTKDRRSYDHSAGLIPFPKFAAETSARSSTGSNPVEEINANKLRKYAALVYKNIVGSDPDQKALDQINVFARADTEKKNIGVETRCIQKLKQHLILQGREKEAKRLEDLYRKLTGMSAMKNREAAILLMYHLFDKERTRSILNEKAAAAAAANASMNATVGSINGNGIDAITEEESRRATVSIDQDHAPIPNLHRNADDVLSRDMTSDTKVPVLMSPLRREGQWKNKLDDLNRGTQDTSNLCSLSKISKCMEETNRNHPTQISLMGSTPTVYSSTPVNQGSRGPSMRNKQLVDLRTIQDSRGGSVRAGTAGTTQTFGNMKTMERDLIRDLIFILQGIDGQHIKTTPNGTYEIDKKLAIHPGLRMQTLKLCELGYCYTIIRNYCEKPQAGLVAQGFKHGMERELQEYYRLLAVIQGKIQQTIVDTPMSEDLPLSQKDDSMTLLKLGIWLFECRPRLQVLSGMVNACESMKGGELCSVIYKYSQHGDPLVRSLTTSLLSVICKPFYIMLSQWILYGELEDPYNEFFIAADPACKREQLWHLKYEIRAKMLPSFITKKQAEKILAIGKNINFLKEICNNCEGYEGRYEIKAMLETGEVESVFSGEKSPIQYAIEMAYKKTSEKVLKVLIEDSNLLDHLKAIKKYLLLGQGDFIQYFLELIQNELSKPASKLYNHNIAAILESAVRATNAQYENEDVLSRLDHRILPASDKDVGWDVFCLDYKVHGPIGTVLTEDVMTSYNKLFNGLWRTKRIEIILSTLWKNQTVVFKYLRMIPELAPVLHRSQLLISEMIHFVYQTQYYIMFEATECAWEKLMEDVNKASDLDEVISSHQKFLNTIIKRSLLDGESRELLNQLRGIFDSVYELRAFLNEFNGHVENEVRIRKGIEPNSEEVQEAQRKFFSSCIKKAKGKIETLYTTTQDLVRTFLLVLNKQQDITLQSLSFRLDFNEYYHQKDFRLTLPLTFQHRRRSSAAFSGNISGSPSLMVNSTLMGTSSIQEIGE